MLFVRGSRPPKIPVSVSGGTHSRHEDAEALDRCLAGRELMAPRTDRTTRIPSGVASPVTTNHAAKGPVFVNLRNADHLKNWVPGGTDSRHEGTEALDCCFRGPLLDCCFRGPLALALLGGRQQPAIGVQGVGFRVNQGGVLSSYTSILGVYACG